MYTRIVAKIIMNGCMYDVFMSNIASWYGTEGDYDTSDRLSCKFIKKLFSSRNWV